jgi:cytochrome c oxidase assembly protein subunit 15
MRERIRNFELSEDRYYVVAWLALATHAIIVLTGSAVRLTGSGLGCPTWPNCYKNGRVVAELDTHAVIEFTNRSLTTVVSAASLAALVGVFYLKPERRDLRTLAFIPILGVAAQVVLGGITVRTHLSPGTVMAHFMVSMLILVGTVALVWRVRHPVGARPRSEDRLLVWSTRALAVLGGVVIFAGTAATASGPHAGGSGTGDLVHRLYFKGKDTLDWTIHQHGALAALLGIGTLVVWYLARRRDADESLREALTVSALGLGAQGVLGGVQYNLELPAELVWIHVALATGTWLAIVWAAVAAGRLVPAGARAGATERPLPDAHASAATR